jgi:hypothetical protein
MITYQVDRIKWSKMSIFDQMGNISSEVGRAINAKKQNNEENTRNAVVRALDLFDATVDELISSKSIRLKEVLRSRDQFLSIIGEQSPSIDELNSLDRYFTQYAIAARIDK